MLALGAAIGGVVATLFGANVALLLDAVSFAVAAWLILPIRPRDMPRDPHEAHQSTTFADGIRYLRRTPAVAALLMV
jgi:hypothetical protein